MSLQVWLPLNGNLKNQGLTKLTVTNNGATVNNNGKIGKCYYFNGSSQYLQLSKSLTNLYTGDFSWAIWLKPTDATRGIIFSECSSAGASNVAFELLANRVIRIYWAASPDWSTGVSIAQNVWSHVAITRHENTLKVYINGELKATKSNATLANKTSSSFIRLGDDYRGGTSVSYMGYMNDARIYNHCLSQKEVEEIAKGLVLHYKLDNNGEGGRNLLLGTNKPIYSTSASTANDRNKGILSGGSGGNGKFSVVASDDVPVGSYSYNITNNTSGNRDFQQGNIPYVTGQIYTGSWWAKGNGSCYFRSWNRTKGSAVFAKTFTLTSDWKFYSYTFTATAAQETNDCTWHLGVTGKASIQIAGMKLELGQVATNYSQAPEDFGLNGTNISDSSGYNYDGLANGIINLSTNTPRYNIASYFGEYNTPNIILQDTSLLPALTNCTVCWWGKYDTTKTLLLTGQSTSVYLAASNNNTFYHAAAGTPIMYKNGIAGTYSCTAGTWDFYVLKNVNLSTWTTLKINSYGSGWPLKGYISDLRIYATELTDEQILELYNTSATIDNKGNVYSREYVENDNLNVTKTGLFQCNKIYDDDELSIASIVKNTQQVQGNTIYEY